MENNYPYSTYPDSNTSTPRSREVDCETVSYDHNANPNPNSYKVKLMCSYGGKILPRPHDNQLTYIGGDTKIITVDRNIRYASITHKLNSLIDSSDMCFKYQLPGEDLDALISVTNDEDLEHMMTEYDRIFRSSVKPVRIRLFMFPLAPSTFGGGDGESKTEQQWFVDALNAVQISSAPTSESTDFLFGFDKGNAPVPAPLKVHDVSAIVVAQTNVPESGRPGSDCGSDDGNNNRHVISEPTVEIQRQMQDYQRMQVAGSHEQTIPRAYYGDYYNSQKIQPAAAAGYWQEQRGGYQQESPPLYLIPSSTGGVYPPAQMNQGQAYYGMQRMDLYREQAQKMGTYQQQQEAIGMVRPGGLGYGGQQVYYTSQTPTTTYPPGLGLVVNEEGNMVNKLP